MNGETEDRGDERAFYASIRQSLRAHPTWLRTALSAFADGMADALAEATERASLKDAAMLAALALCDTKRVSPQLRQTLMDTIGRGISPTCASDIERRFLARGTGG